jgi:hypothetical protein
MARADYCGDGRSFTRNGTAINLYDRIGIQSPEPSPDMSFEAAWGPDGAVFVRKTRHPVLISMDELLKMCPRLNTRKIEKPNGQAVGSELEDALVFNES